MTFLARSTYADLRISLRLVRVSERIPAARARPLLTDCPECGKPTFNKLVTAAGFQLKGSGWYATDFKNSGAKPKADKGADKDKDKAADKPRGQDCGQGIGQSCGQTSGYEERRRQVRIQRHRRQPGLKAATV